MEPIPEKYQVLAGNAVIESSEYLQKYSQKLRDSIKRMNLVNFLKLHINSKI